VADPDFEGDVGTTVVGRTGTAYRHWQRKGKGRRSGGGSDGGGGGGGGLENRCCCD
jgi:hypothetical protein